MKKRLTITLSDSVLENLEKMAKEMVIKICDDFGCSRKLQERSSKIKSRAGRGLLDILYLG